MRRSLSVNPDAARAALPKAVLRLLPRNIKTYDGQVILAGEDIMALDDETFRRTIRWKRISMVPQAAMNALNPVMRIGEQVAEPAMVHLSLTKKKPYSKRCACLNKSAYLRILFIGTHLN